MGVASIFANRFSASSGAIVAFYADAKIAP